jgi:hypothetical protein
VERDLLVKEIQLPVDNIEVRFAHLCRHGHAWMTAQRLATALSNASRCGDE